MWSRLSAGVRVTEWFCSRRCSMPKRGANGWSEEAWRRPASRGCRSAYARPRMENEFSVYQFFRDDTSERVREFVGAADAVMTARSLTQSVGGRIGTTQRVIITDG